jgi:hypothetical protein
VPTAALWPLFVVVLLESPFLAARSALLVDVLPDDRYVLASALGNMAGHAVQVLGFAAGGSSSRSSARAWRCSWTPHQELASLDDLLQAAAAGLAAQALVGFSGCRRER